jgi:hypothetical protein
MFSFLGPRVVFPLDPKTSKPLLVQFLKTNSQFSLVLIIPYIFDLRFGTWNIRSLYRSRSLKTEAGELGILGRLAGGVDWIRLARNRDRWRSVVNAAMNLRVLAPRS